MKRLLLIILLACLASFQLEAQNANRSGVFAELGLGVSLGGETPINGAHLEGTKIKLEKSTGPGFLVNVGYRYSQWKSIAFEMKVQYQGNFSHTASTSLIKFMPGYKYFAPKAMLGTIFGVNAGVVLSSTGSTLEPGFVKPADFLSPMKVGFAWSVEWGYAINRNIYACLVWDNQYTKGQTTTKIKTLGWSMLAVKIGYRF